VETIKQRLGRGELVMMCAVGRVLNHNLIQLLGFQGGFHGIWFDLEHVGNGMEHVEIGAMAARSQGLDSFVRLAPTDYAAISRSLESGASGIMAAQVKTAAQAEEIVRWSKFYPRGCRGLNTGGFDAGFGKMAAAEYCEKANRETLVIIQIETCEAVEEAEAIAAIDGVDLLFVGPADLSQNLGVTGDFWNEKCIRAIDRVSAACKKHNKPWGVVPASPEHGAMCVEKGCRMLSPCSDVKLLNVGIAGTKQTYSKFFA
jgi:2-dehydro-3-deoxyglucarate aldolase/4-hydroxy-2-oxoheptanedioate aldolase